ncbi:hypothetical protein HID58_020451 [Brassica napus]|uniref:JmjC domain-containing protein n=1 Tax=Brassica napus TaxID=3708 RepID=A0ABQ7X0N2_BRANA|nr:hypothetical protein HID58_096334 [Brassica napus]KAH0855153.1 hypothetical protein HID58_020451 [Brassica napus]
MSGAPTAASSGNHSLHLPTPTLDAESQSLLQSISAQGGYAYARMAALAVAGDQSAAEAARDMAWEQLHSGPWHSVLPVWRDAYSMACLHVAKFHFAAGEFGEALGALDMGLIMGGTLLRKDLHDSVLLVSSEARKKAKSLGDFKGEKLVPEVPVDVNEVLKILPLRSLTSGRVDKRSDLSMEGFLRDYFQTGTPVVITNCMAHWPARTKWNHLDYLTSVAGNRTVPVEVGKNYLCSDWKQELVTFSKFLERMRTNRSTSVEPTYLAQHPLFDQVVGKKYIRLYPSSLQDELYPYSETMLCNSSQVDLDNIDKNEFPKVVELEFMDCILEEGEMLYIPPKWWHYVRSLTMSFSVSFWWSNEAESSDS